MKIRKPKREEYDAVAVVVNSELDLYRTVLSQKKLKEICVGGFTKKDLIEGEAIRNYLIVTEDKKIVGFISWYKKPNKAVWISMLQVDAKHRNQGIGSLLLKRVEKIARKNGARVIALEVQRRAYWAVDFYKFNRYFILSEKDLNKEPFKNTLSKPPVKNTFIFGKKID
ncbi:MAG: hypothetical protein COU85_02755 [Candidatus Portnoybacteria bacterium CG10_big_fil_rev_8_21_14_0_10_44_7]|uniref:N-acetyltransferase domain-containing protein n=1 Tax=Candidatus Portnoybacteria bacterium CG10_big_fil_rev_8_21_14_0_10_44_7 TaxID=1974816 RepID=A0A2M8KI48_9BACT|nr:MAG: hypothetical protein COU85_02755 [Candidatus Portnoybacteria bacterium CG10_big_fil_rev_8_21_14_0_10_44_7]